MSKVAKQEYSKKSQRLKVIERKQVLLGRSKKSYTDALYYIHSRTFVPVIIPVEIGQKHRELHKKNVNKKEQKTTCTRNEKEMKFKRFCDIDLVCAKLNLSSINDYLIIDMIKTTCCETCHNVCFSFWWFFQITSKQNSQRTYE